jgi:hypothetical protein
VYISAMIKASKLSNIMTTSHYRISAVVQPVNQVQQSRPPKESTQARACTNGIEGANRRIRHWASIHGHRQWNKPDIRKNPEGNEHLAGMPEADRLLFPRNSTRKCKSPLRKIELDVCFGDSGNFRREKLEFEVMDWPS